MQVLLPFFIRIAVKYLVLVWTGEISLFLPDSGGTITKLGSSPFYSDDLLQILNQC